MPIPLPPDDPLRTSDQPTAEFGRRSTAEPGETHPHETRSLPGEAPGSGTFPDEVRDLMAALGLTLPGTEGGGEVASPGGELRIAGYEVGDEIARGGMGLVLAARELSLGREVAIKVLLPGRDSAEAARRFVVEARITSQLPHPGIPPVHHLGLLPNGRPFLAMKLIRGRTLAALLADRPSPASDLPQFVGVFEQICQAVGFAHGRGVVHRDLKPLNVMVGAFGEVQVMDWGLARSGLCGDRESGGGVADAPPERTQPGAVMGTPAYMPPEQARGESVGPPADVFALGGILCDILTGSPTFTGASSLEVVRKAATGDMSEAFTRLDACGAASELVALAKRCLSPNPADRFADAEAVATEVGAYRTGVEERLRSAERERAAAEARAVEQRKRWRVQLALAAALGLLLSGGGAFAWWQDTQRRDRATERAEAAAGRQAAEARTALAELERVRVEGENRAAQSRRDAERAAAAQQARAGATALLGLAVELRGKYRFEEAGAAVEQAARAIADGAEDMRPVVERARSDLAFARELDEIDGRKSLWISEAGGGGRFNTAAAPPAYRAAFGKRGFEFDAGDPGELADRVKRSAVRTELIDALDDWATHEPDAATASRLLEVLRRADPGPWSDRFRDPVARADPAAVRELAADPAAAAGPPSRLIALAELLARHGADPLPLLALAQTRHRASFPLAVAAAHWHFTRKSPEAVSFYRSALAIRPDHQSALLNLSVALTNRGEIPAAESLCREVIRDHPKLALAHYDLGVILSARNDRPGAVAAYRKAVELDPSDSITWHNLGSSLDEMGKGAEALAAYREAVRLRPGYAKAHYGLGNALRDLGDIPGAMAAYRTAILHDPHLARPYYNLGLLLFGAGDEESALVYCREGVRRDPLDAKAHCNLGLVLAQTGSLPAALDSLREAVRLDPSDPLNHANLGLASYHSRDHDTAVTAFRAAIKLRPKAGDFHIPLGLALRDRGDFAEAAAVLTRAKELGAAPAPHWIPECEGLARKADRLAAVLSGAEEANDAAELLVLADTAQRYQRRYADAVWLFREAFAVSPAVGAGNPAIRENAARAAVLAARGRGVDPPPVRDRAAHRKSAREWFAAELAAWRKRAADSPEKAGPAALARMRAWLSDREYAPVRNVFHLAALPAAEVRAWRALWDGVRAFRDELTAR